MSKAAFLWMLICTVALAAIAMPAHADFLGLKLAGALNCGGGGGVNSTIFGNQGVNPSVCDSNPGYFSRFMCLFQTTLGMVIATFFCHLSQAWIAPFGALLLMFMTALGIMFITGILEFNVKEISVAMFKIGLITTFAFNTEIALNVAFAFFLNVTQNTVEMFSQAFTGGAGTFDHADASVAGSVGISTGSATQDRCHFSGLAGSMAIAGLVLLGLIMALFIPFIIGLLALAAISVSGFFSRAAFGYLYSLVMLTFLIAAMPVFLSLALFESTRDSFQAWLAQLFSNCIQIVIVFAFLAFAYQVDFGNFITQISTLLVTKHVTFSFPPITWVIGDDFGGYCTICDPNLVSNPKYPTLQEIAAEPNQCKSPMRALDWSEIPFQGEFLTFLLVHGAALYLLTSTMGEFMKMVPEIAQKLGGHDSSLTIGGVPRNYGGSGDSNTISAPGLTAGTVAFEEGFRRGYRNWETYSGKQSFGKSVLARSSLGRLTHGFREAFSSAKYGTSNLDRDQHRAMIKKGAMAMANADRAVTATGEEVTRQKKELDRLEEEEARKAQDLADAKVDLAEQKQAFADSKVALDIARTQSALIKCAMAGTQVAETQKKIEKLEKDYKKVAEETAGARQELEVQKAAVEKSEIELNYKREQLAKVEKELDGSKKKDKRAKEDIEKRKEEITQLEKDHLEAKEKLGEIETRVKPQLEAYDQAVKALNDVHTQVKQVVEQSENNPASINLPDSERKKLQQALDAAQARVQETESATREASQTLIKSAQANKAVQVALSINTTLTSKTITELHNAEQDFEKAINQRIETFDSWKDPMRARSSLALRDKIVDEDGKERIVSHADLEGNKSSRGWWDDLWNPDSEQERFFGRRRETDHAHSKETWFQMLQFKD